MMSLHLSHWHTNILGAQVAFGKPPVIVSGFSCEALRSQAVLRLPLIYAGFIAVAILIFAAFIGVLIIGGNLIGQALGSKELDSADPRLQRAAMGRLILALSAFSALCWLFTHLIGMLP